MITFSKTKTARFSRRMFTYNAQNFNRFFWVFCCYLATHVWECGNFKEKTNIFARSDEKFRLFLKHLHTWYLTDLWFQQSNHLPGTTKAVRMWCSGKYKRHEYNIEVSVLPTGFASPAEDQLLKVDQTYRFYNMVHGSTNIQQERRN